MITQCPNCRAKFKARDELKGKEACCPNCKQGFRVKQITEKSRPLINRQSPESRKEDVCSNCGQDINQSEQACVFQGRVVCSECDARLRKPMKPSVAVVPGQDEKRVVETEDEILSPSADNTLVQLEGRILRSNNQEACFFCDSGSPSDDNAAFAPVSRLVEEVGSDAAKKIAARLSGTTGASTAGAATQGGVAVYERKDVLVPRCYNCRRIHNHLALITFAGLLLGVGFGGYYGFATVVGNARWWLAFLAVVGLLLGGGVIGAVIGHLACLFYSSFAAPPGMKEELDKKEYHLVKHMLSKGWENRKRPNVQASDFVELPVTEEKSSESLPAEQESTSKALDSPLRYVVATILVIVLFPVFYYVADFVKDIRFKSEMNAENKVLALIDSVIPADGVYDKGGSSGGDYVDPIHGFFKVQPPYNCEIKANELETTYRVEAGPNAGKTTPMSRVLFSCENCSISVRAGKTFIAEADEDWISETKQLYQAKFGNAPHRSRWITIDGARGNEHVFWSPQDHVSHVVQYKKHGLKHVMFMVCERSKFKEAEKDLQAFARSYTSLESD